MDTDVMNISFDDFQSVSSNVLMNLWKKGKYIKHFRYIPFIKVQFLYIILPDYTGACVTKD